jgi:hypothetical protein
MGKIITIKNSHGEIIYIKLEDGILMVHHTDCTENYITLNDFYLKYILNNDELVKIYNAGKELYIETLTPEIGKLFKIK